MSGHNLLRALWTHSRNINVAVFQGKVVYDIPLYNDLLFKNFRVDYTHSSLLLTTYRCPLPVALDLEEPLSYNPLVESERPGGSDRCSVSHQHLFREMK
jgi:hypothetical protein